MGYRIRYIKESKEHLLVCHFCQRTRKFLGWIPKQSRKLFLTLKPRSKLMRKLQSSNTNVVFKHTLGKAYTSSIQTRISNALLVGAVIGIILLGYTCDIWSRRGGLWVTSSLVVVGSLLATLVFQVEGQGVGDMMWYMTIARGITGVGVGGEYPPSAAAALEGSNEVNFAIPLQNKRDLEGVY
jgi:MFS family permease